MKYFCKIFLWRFVKMTEWIPATEDFIEADVIRWTEPVWSDKKRGRGKNAKYVMLAKQSVVGQIKGKEGDYVLIEVISAEIAPEGENNENKSYQTLRPYAPGSVIRKKPSTLVKNAIERLLWSDESARNSIKKDKGQ
ncbi:MAG: hypothetical protein EA357_00780 [Micavibrio sp.]|nr:MAG: hypothetical protein EA357_00780 [Micavibrio sp.]